MAEGECDVPVRFLSVVVDPVLTAKAHPSRFKKNSPHAKEERERQQKLREAMHEE